MSTSSLPVVKAALVTLFTSTFAAQPTVSVFYGPANGHAREVVSVGTTLNPEQQSWATLGNKQRGEDYALVVYIEVDRKDVTQQAATERAFALLASIETAVRADVTLGLAAQYRSLEAQVTQAHFYEWSDPDSQGFSARVDTAILVKTRI